MKFVEVDETNKSEFFDMYFEYVKILQAYDVTIKTQSLDDVERRLEFPYSQMFLLQHQDNVVGFIILGFGFMNSFSGHDVFIEEFFIKPEHQKQHLGSLAIQELVKSYPDYDFSAFIIETNKPAQNFWETTFARCGYVERTLFGHITAKCDNLDFKYWIKQRG